MTDKNRSDDRRSVPALPSEASADVPVGPPTNALKERFSAQKIPLQTDFFDLIDVANCGRTAVGQAPGQPGGTGAGLQLDSNGRLAARATPDSGLIVQPDGVGVIADTSKGIGITADGVGVRSGELLDFDTDGRLQVVTGMIKKTFSFTGTGVTGQRVWRTVTRDLNVYTPINDPYYLQLQVVARSQIWLATQTFDLIASYANYTGLALTVLNAASSRNFPLIYNVRIAGFANDGAQTTGVEFEVVNDVDVDFSLRYSPFLVDATLMDLAPAEDTWSISNLAIDESKAIQKALG